MKSSVKFLTEETEEEIFNFDLSQVIALFSLLLMTAFSGGLDHWVISLSILKRNLKTMIRDNPDLSVAIETNLR